MLTIYVEPRELYDENTSSFVTTEGTELQLEHSLKSVSEWEGIYKKPFLHTQRTIEELIDYVKMMTVNNVPDTFDYSNLSESQLIQVIEYINTNPTATTINNHEKKSKKEIITAELIYYWMIGNQIPIEFETRNLNRLLTLIQIFSIKNQPPKKMSKAQTLRNNHALNQARRAKTGSKG